MTYGEDIENVIGKIIKDVGLRYGQPRNVANENKNTFIRSMLFLLWLVLIASIDPMDIVLFEYINVIQIILRCRRERLKFYAL